MPGFGKSGMLRMARSISGIVGREEVMSLRHGVPAESAFGRFEFFNHFAHLAQGDVLNLADTFARHAEFFPDFFERFFRAAVQPEPRAQKGGLWGGGGLGHFLP